MDGHSFFHLFDKYLYNTATMLDPMPDTYKWITEGFSFREWIGLLCCLCPKNTIKKKGKKKRKQKYLPAQVHMETSYIQEESSHGGQSFSGIWYHDSHTTRMQPKVRGEDGGIRLEAFLFHSVYVWVL